MGYPDEIRDDIIEDEAEAYRALQSAAANLLHGNMALFANDAGGSGLFAPVANAHNQSDCGNSASR